MLTFEIIAKQFALQSRLFNNVLEGIADNKGQERPSQEVNHLQWIAGHLTTTRFNFASLMGMNDRFPYKDLFIDASQPPPNNRKIDDSLPYPSLTETLKYWNDFSGKFTEGVSKLTAEQAVIEMPFGNPIGDKTMLGLFAFLASHESYHIGQMSLLRKYLGLEAMSYK